MVAPSYSPLIVLVATRSGSTSSSSSAQRSTARTILFTSTGSVSPLRLRTCMRAGAAPGLGAGLPAVIGDRHGSLLASSLRKPGTRARDGARQPAATRHAIPSAVPRGLRPPRAGARGALAGLRTRGHGASRRLLLAVASQADQAQCCSPRLAHGRTAVVPAHRCGAVPDSHRVPSCLREPGRTAEPAAGNTIYGRLTESSTTCRVGVSRLASAGAPPFLRPWNFLSATDHFSTSYLFCQLRARFVGIAWSELIARSKELKLIGRRSRSVEEWRCRRCYG